MPIKDKSKYPKDWKEISEFIRFTRAKGRCECTGECGLHHNRRCIEEHNKQAHYAKGKVILTVAHLDHDPGHSEHDNLKAMCQRCHNRYDAPFRKMNRFRDRIKGDIEQRVLVRGKFDDLNNCWEWQGCLSVEGYGKVRIDNKTDYVHRFMMSWILGRELKKDEHVDHLCKNRKCFRPSHLELVTPAENTRRGDQAKLTTSKILMIRKLRRKGYGVVVLGELFKVNSSHISRICNYERWGTRKQHQANARETRRNKKAIKDLF